VLAFVHIPKTAGGTVTSMFIGAYTREGIAKAGNFVRGPEKTGRKLTRRAGRWKHWYANGGRVAIGHVPYGVYREHLPADARYMTFLREPVDRVLSHYYRHHHRSDPSRAGRRKEREGKAKRVMANSIEEALADPRLPQLKNLATRFLCGDPSPMGELPAGALDDAKANLHGFAFLGVQERFDESLVLLQRMLDLDISPAAYENRHVTSASERPRVDEIPEVQRELILELNQLDAELYEYGSKLFEETVPTDEGFAAAVTALREERHG